MSLSQTPAAGVTPLNLTVVVANVPCLLTAATTTNLYTVPNGKRFVLTSIVVHDPNGNAGSGTINLGSSNTSATSLMSAAVLTKLGTTAASSYSEINMDSGSSTVSVGAPVLSQGDVIQLVPQTAATGVTVQVDVLGYLVP